MALLDENVMSEFVQQANCGGKCNCFDKIRDGMNDRYNGENIVTNLSNLDDAIVVVFSVFF